MLCTVVTLLRKKNIPGTQGPPFISTSHSSTDSQGMAGIPGIPKKNPGIPVIFSNSRNSQNFIY